MTKAKTIYQGYYIDVRNGVRVGIKFTYQTKGIGGICNEKEVSVTPLNP